MNTDYARIRPFFRPLFGLSSMNADMSVFMGTMSVFVGAMSVFNYTVSVHGPHGQCSWPPRSVFTVHVVSVNGHHVSVHLSII